jgi:hypothetical protein
VGLTNKTILVGIFALSAGGVGYGDQLDGTAYRGVRDEHRLVLVVEVLSPAVGPAGRPVDWDVAWREAWGRGRWDIDQRGGEGRGG